MAKSKFILQNISDSYPIMNEISELVIKFHDVFMQKKLEQNILSFDDLEEFTLEILSKKKILEPFTEILIDEYQDINDVQENFVAYSLQIKIHGWRCETKYLRLS